MTKKKPEQPSPRRPTPDAEWPWHWQKCKGGSWLRLGSLKLSIRRSPTPPRPWRLWYGLCSSGSAVIATDLTRKELDAAQREAESWLARWLSQHEILLRRLQQSRSAVPATEALCRIEIDATGETAREAAQQAEELMRDPMALPWIVDVLMPGADAWATIDLEQEEPL